MRMSSLLCAVSLVSAGSIHLLEQSQNQLCVEEWAGPVMSRVIEGVHDSSTTLVLVGMLAATVAVYLSGKHRSEQ